MFFLKIEFYFTSSFCSEHEIAIGKNVYVISRGIIECLIQDNFESKRELKFIIQIFEISIY